MGCNYSSAPTATRESPMDHVEGRVGKAAVHGRYHRLPERIEDDYIVTEKILGRGAFSVVKQAISKDGGTVSYAVKNLPTRNLTKEDKDQLEMEVDVFLGMDHRHVVRLFDVYEAEHHMFLVMECMEGKELFDRVVEQQRFSEADAVEAVNQMLLSINYLHVNGCIHRDIKLENFLYTKIGSNHLKLIDFGFAKFCDPSMLMNNGCGTLAYCAPEVIKMRYTNKADLWSIGVIAFILLSGYMPFIGEDVRTAILAGKVTWKPEKWTGVSQEAVQFVKALLTVDPDKRLSASEALVHPWIAKSGDKGKVEIDRGIVDGLLEYSSTSKFRRSCLEMMAWSLSYEEREMVAKQFLAMDTQGKGTVTLGELKKVMVDQFQISDEETQKVFEAMDSNNDQTIHYSDFLAAMLTTRIKLHANLLTKTFRRFDRENTGYIGVEQLQRVFGASEDVSKLLEEADVLQEGRVSYKAFVAYLTKQPIEATSAVVRDASVRAIDKEMRRLSEKGIDVGQGGAHMSLQNLDLQTTTAFDSRQVSVMTDMTTNFDQRQVSTFSAISDGGTPSFNQTPQEITRPQSQERNGTLADVILEEAGGA